eukprot:1914944-Rhodomonas_salina.1
MSKGKKWRALERARVHTHTSTISRLKLQQHIQWGSWQAAAADPLRFRVSRRGTIRSSQTNFSVSRARHPSFVSSPVSISSPVPISEGGFSAGPAPGSQAENVRLRDLACVHPRFHVDWVQGLRIIDTASHSALSSCSTKIQYEPRIRIRPTRVSRTEF